MCAVGTYDGEAGGAEVGKTRLVLEPGASCVIIASHIHCGCHAVGCQILEAFDVVNVEVAIDEAGDEVLSGGVDGSCNVLYVRRYDAFVENHGLRRCEARSIEYANVCECCLDLSCWGEAAYSAGRAVFCGLLVMRTGGRKCKEVAQNSEAEDRIANQVHGDGRMVFCAGCWQVLHCSQELFLYVSIRHCHKPMKAVTSIRHTAITLQLHTRTNHSRLVKLYIWRRRDSRCSAVLQGCSHTKPKRVRNVSITIVANVSLTRAHVQACTLNPDAIVLNMSPPRQSLGVKMPWLQRQLTARLETGVSDARKEG